MASILKVDTIQDQSGNNIINESGDTITIGASGDTITIPSGATLTNNGTQTGLTLSDNILFDTASKGIYLGVTSATASNLLDDYEEGTWTPTVIVSGIGDVVQAGDITSATYKKIGNIVSLHLIFDLSGNSNSYGNATTFRNLPFTPSRDSAGSIDDIDVCIEIQSSGRVTPIDSGGGTSLNDLKALGQKNIHAIYETS